MDNLPQLANRSFSIGRIVVNSWNVSQGVPTAKSRNPSTRSSLVSVKTIYECPLVSRGTILGNEVLGEIGGKALSDGVPFSGTILLFEEDSKDCISVTQSGLNGAFVFRGLPTSKRYFVVGINENLSMNYSIRAHLQPIE